VEQVANESATYQLLHTSVDEVVLARRLNLYMVEAVVPTAQLLPCQRDLTSKAI
jgi:hypothetical protein